MNLIMEWIRRLKFGVQVTILFFIFNVPLFASFEDTSVGGRATGMGGIFVSLTDDVNSIYQNPAGLSLIKQTEFSAQYNKLHVGLSDNSNLGSSFLGIAYPLKFQKDHGTLGLGWLRFELSELYHEDSFILSYARYGIIKYSNLGINLKYLSLGYGQDEYTANALDTNGTATGQEDSLFKRYGTSTSNIDFDLGWQYDIAQNYKFGFVVANILEPNMALDKSCDGKLPRTYKAGIAHTGKTYAVNVESLMKKYNQTTDWNLATGGEKCFSYGLALRAGFNYGSRNFTNVSCGVGYKMDSFQIDYALVYPLGGIKETMGNHKISLLVRFGPIIERFPDTKELKVVFEKNKTQLADTEKKLATANEEIDKLKKNLEEVLKRASVVKQPVQANKEFTLVKNSTMTIYYRNEWKKYQQTAETLSLNERLKRVSNIIKKYRNNNIIIDEAEQEYLILVDEQKAQNKYYQDALSYYKKMVNQGSKYKERINLIKRVINKFKDSVNIAEAAKEYNNVVREYNGNVKNYKDSLSYYKKMVTKGIDKKEQIDILKRMINKYDPLDIDVSELKKELAKCER